MCSGMLAMNLTSCAHLTLWTISQHSSPQFEIHSALSNVARAAINPAAKLVQRPACMHLAAGELHRLMDLCSMGSLALYQCKCGARRRLFLIFHLFICLLEWPSCCARGFIVVPPTAAGAPPRVLARVQRVAGDHIASLSFHPPLNYKCNNRKIAQAQCVHPL